MSLYAKSTCEICGQASTVRLTELHHGEQFERAFCSAHAPAERAVSMASDEKLVSLRQQLAQVGRELVQEAKQADVLSELDRLIGEAEELRRRLSQA